MFDKKVELKKLQNEVKYSVIITDVIMTFYVLWLIITNTSTPIPGILFGYTPIGTWMLLHASELFNLCPTYKCMIIHTLSVYGCSLFHLNIGFGIISLCFMRWIMLIWGIILMIIIVNKIIKGISCI